MCVKEKPRGISSIVSISITHSSVSVCVYEREVRGQQHPHHQYHRQQTHQCVDAIMRVRKQGGISISTNNRHSRTTSVSICVSEREATGRRSSSPSQYLHRQQTQQCVELCECAKLKPRGISILIGVIITDSTHSSVLMYVCARKRSQGGISIIIADNRRNRVLICVRV